MSDFATPWTTAHQASLSFTISWSLLKLLSIESVMPSNHLSSVVPFSPCPQSFPVSGSFLMSQLFASGGQRIGASALASVLPMNIQDWFPLGLTDLISKESACNAGDPGLISGSGRPPGEENGFPLQYSCLKNPMDREAWSATIHRVAVRQNLSDWTHTCRC